MTARGMTRWERTHWGRVLVWVVLALVVCTHPSEGEEETVADVVARIDQLEEGFEDPTTHEAAERYLKRIAQESQGRAGRRPVRAAALRALATLEYEERDNFEAALRWLTLLLQEHRLPPVDRKGIADAELFRGVVLAATNQNDAAIGALSRAIGIKRELGDELGVATGLMTLSRAYAAMDEIKTARRRAEEALDIYQRLNNPHGIAAMQYELGDIHLLLGDSERAKEGYLAYLNAVAARDRGAAWIEAKADVAIALYSMDEMTDARRMLQEALDYYAERRNERAALRVHVHMARLHVKEERYQEALDSAKLALAHEDLHPLLHPYAQIAAGHAELGLNHPPAAIKYFRAALAVAEEQGSIMTKVEAGDGLARALLAAKRPAQALRRVKNVGRLMEQVTRDLTARDRMSYRRVRPQLFETALRAAAALGSHKEIAWALEFDRGLSLQASLVPRGLLTGQVRTATYDAMRVARDRDRAARDALSKIDPSQKKEHQQAREELDAAERAHAVARDNVRKEASDGVGGAYTAISTLFEMMAALRPHEAFVLLGLLPERALALVIRGGGAPTRLVEFDRAVIQKLGKKLRRGSAPEQFDRTGEASPSGDDRSIGPPRRPHSEVFENALKQAARVIVDELGLSQEITHVYVSPQAGFATIPWPAIFAHSKASHARVALIPSVGTYRLIMEDRGKPGSGVVALGDPKYPAPGTDTVSAAALKRLRGTAQEAKHAARAEGDAQLLGPDATKTRLFDELAQRWKQGQRLRLLLLGCHGEVDWDDEQKSALRLTPDASAPDGRLRVEDIREYPINANLVILSACDTGAGPFDKGEGLRGFARAVLAAGAPRVIVSLWPVHDKATAQLMIHLCDRLEAGDSAASALAAAQKELRDSREWKHPRYWAAWVLWGLAD